MSLPARIRIRRARPGDAGDLALIDEMSSAVPWSRESFERELSDNRIALYLVAEDEDGIIGYMGLWRVADEGHITNIAVAPGYRRMRIATNLMETMFDIAGEEGIHDYTLEVRVSNSAALALYAEQGFRSVGVRKNYYYDNGEDAYIMWRMMTGKEAGYR